MNAPILHGAAAEAGASSAKIKFIADRWPEEFRLGYRFGFRGKADPPCGQAGYPSGFHTWPLGRRNAWFAGWNRGRVAVDIAAASEGGGDG
jgi:hypothetical protein